MSKEKSVDPNVPGIAFATLPTTGETIAISCSRRFYFRVNSNKTADELNALYGVTPDQAKALLASVMTDWENNTDEPERSDAA